MSQHTRHSIQGKTLLVIGQRQYKLLGHTSRQHQRIGRIPNRGWDRLYEYISHYLPDIAICAIVGESNNALKKRLLARDPAPTQNIPEGTMLKLASIQLLILQCVQPGKDLALLVDLYPCRQRIDKKSDHRVDPINLARTTRNHRAKHNILIAAITTD